MTQQEIFQHMTPGQWDVMNGHPSEINSAESGDSFIQCNDLSKDFHGTSETDKANAALIVLMHRETIDKHINPEGVGKMHELVSDVLRWMKENEDSLTIEYDWHTIRRFEEALTTATKL